MARLWSLKVAVISVLIGALGEVSKNLQEYLQKIRVTVKTELLQKAALEYIKDIFLEVSVKTTQFGLKSFSYISIGYLVGSTI